MTNQYQRLNKSDCGLIYYVICAGRIVRERMKTLEKPFFSLSFPIKNKKPLKYTTTSSIAVSKKYEDVVRMQPHFSSYRLQIVDSINLLGVYYISPTRIGYM